MSSNTLIPGLGVTFYYDDDPKQDTARVAHEKEVVLEPWRKLLWETANVIEKKGHCQERGGMGRRGEVCVLIGMGNAIRKLNGEGIIIESNDEQRALKALKLRIGQIIVWNDSTPTAEVLKTLRLAAVL